LDPRDNYPTAEGCDARKSSFVDVNEAESQQNKPSPYNKGVLCDARVVLSIWDLGFGIWDWDLGFGIWDLGFGISDLGFGIWDLGFRIWDLGFGIATGARANPQSQIRNPKS
jgi:hypothetical protein